MNTMNERQTASMETWQALGDAGQAEITLKAARRVAYIAWCYGVKLTADEIWGGTWEGTTKRMTCTYLSKANGQREQPLTIWQIAFRGAHTAAETWRYDRNKYGYSLPLEAWNGVDGYDVESVVIDRLAIADCLTGLDSRGRAVAELIVAGHTEREVGKAVGISGVAVHKRVVKMRRRGHNTAANQNT